MRRSPTATRAARLRAAPRWAGAGLALGLVGAMLPAASPSLAVAETQPSGADSAVATSIHYADWLAHAGDPNAFEPGERVTVGYRPRPSVGAATVDGARPRSLPAGRLSGVEMTEVADTAAVGATDGPSAAASPAAAPRQILAAPNLQREVFGFLPYWELTDSDTTLDYDVLSTIAYFSVGSDADGNLLKTDENGDVTTGWGGWTSSTLTGTIDAAHARGTRVVLTATVFAWTSTQRTLQGRLLGDPAARANLAAQLAAAVRDRGADGVNLDFEPIVAGHEADFTDLVRTLRTALDAYAPGYQITVDTFGRPENFQLEALLAAGVDAFFIMGYDYRIDSSSVAGSISPLTGPAYDLTETVALYQTRVSPDRLILGIPYYGRAWSTVSDAVRAQTQSGVKYGYPAAPTYDVAVELATENGRRWDDEEQAPWTAYQRENCTSTYGCVTSWRELYYDDPQSLGLKYDLAIANNLRGVGMWALGYDGIRPELTALLHQKFAGPPPPDTTPPVAGIVVLPPQTTDEGFVVGWTATDPSGVVSYDVQVSIDAGAWRDWQLGTSATSAVYLGRSGHGYAFRVRATDALGNLGDWVIGDVYRAAGKLAVGGFGQVTASAVAVRTDPSTSATRVLTIGRGTLMEITGGPRSAGGYTWYQVSVPLTEWGTVTAPEAKVWVAAARAGTTYVSATSPPSSTYVLGGLYGVAFGDAGPPSIGAAGAALRTFSPNGDGSRDGLAVTWKNRVALRSLAANIFRPDGSLVGSIPLTALAAGQRRWEWDGRVGGSPLPDGSYVLQLVGKAASVTYAWPSANPTVSPQPEAFGLAIDTLAPTLVSSTISATTFSPDGDSQMDAIEVTGSAPEAVSWSVAIAPLEKGAPGPAVRTISGPGTNAAVTWDGRDDAGRRLVDGTYRVALSLLDGAGNAAAASWDVILETPDPNLTVSVSPAAVSPDGDGTADRAALAWTSDMAVSGEVRVIHGSTVVARWTQGAGTTGTVSWDGRDGKGKAAADGAYVVAFDLADPVGNRVVKTLPLIVDRTAGFLRATPTAFHPQDGDAIAPKIRVTFTLTRTAVTRLAVLDASGTAIRGAWSERTLKAGTHPWTWDGKAAGAFVTPGRYTLLLTARTSLGTVELRRAVVVDAFAVTPSDPTPAAGDVLTLTIVASEPLRAAPTVTFTQVGLAPQKATAVAVKSGRYRVTFTVGDGAGPAVIVVSGRDTGGGLERSVATVTVQ